MRENCVVEKLHKSSASFGRQSMTKRSSKLKSANSSRVKPYKQAGLNEFYRTETYEAHGSTCVFSSQVLRIRMLGLGLDRTALT